MHISNFFNGGPGQNDPVALHLGDPGPMRESKLWWTIPCASKKIGPFVRRRAVQFDRHCVKGVPPHPIVSWGTHFVCQNPFDLDWVEIDVGFLFCRQKRFHSFSNGIRMDSLRIALFSKRRGLLALIMKCRQQIVVHGFGVRIARQVNRVFSFQPRWHRGVPRSRSEHRNEFSMVAFRKNFGGHNVAFVPYSTFSLIGLFFIILRTDNEYKAIIANGCLHEYRKLIAGNQFPLV